MLSLTFNNTLFPNDKTCLDLSVLSLQLVLYSVRVCSFLNHPFSGCCSEPPLNNPNPSLLLLSQLSSLLWFSPTSVCPGFSPFFLQTDILCSVIKPDCKSCRLYNGGCIACNQVSAMLVSASFAQCDFTTQLCDFVTSSAIHLHSSLTISPDGFLHLFPIRSPQQFYNFCSVGQFGKSA